MALAFLLPLPYRAAQVLWRNLVTSGIQGVGLAFECGEAGSKKRPTRRGNEGIISGLFLERTVLVSIVMVAGTLLLFQWQLDRSGALIQAQSVALTTMVACQMAHVGNARSERQSLFSVSPMSNPFLLIGTVAAFLLKVGALYLPFMQFLLHVEPIDLAAWLRIAPVTVVLLAVVEAHKALRT